jgi:molecular chaperone GrpE
MSKNEKEKIKHESEAETIEGKAKEPVEDAEKPLEPTQDDIINGLTGEKEKYHNNWLRAEAELDNYRKRVFKEKEEFRKFALEGLIKEMLTPIDYLEMAVKHAQCTKNVDSLIQGVEYTHKCLLDILKGYGVEPVESENKDFDPGLHEAHEVLETEEVENGKVLKEHRKAYKICGRG